MHFANTLYKSSFYLNSNFNSFTVSNPPFEVLPQPPHFELPSHNWCIDVAGGIPVLINYILETLNLQPPLIQSRLLIFMW